MKTFFHCFFLFSLFLNGAISAQISESAPPMPPSPVDQFRHWLDLKEDEIQAALADYPADKRAVLQEKLKEYALMPEVERERRLKMVELRHYLHPLMQSAVEEREQKLRQIPASLKPLVLERLKQWDGLEPNFQKAVLDSEWASRYFVRLQTARPQERIQLLVNLKPDDKTQVETKLALWKQLPQHERLRRYAQFNSFFELPPAKKEKTLGLLTEKERAEMEKTLRMFDQLSLEQRSTCIDSFRKFANMSVTDRALFLESAERWKSMPAEDREAWRRLVQSVPPLPSELPPMPMDGTDGPPMP